MQNARQPSWSHIVSPHDEVVPPTHYADTEVIPDRTQSSRLRTHGSGSLTLAFASRTFPLGDTKLAAASSTGRARALVGGDDVIPAASCREPASAANVTQARISIPQHIPSAAL